jgi:hypothetical protein
MSIERMNFEVTVQWSANMTADQKELSELHVLGQDWDSHRICNVFVSAIVYVVTTETK